MVFAKAGFVICAVVAAVLPVITREGSGRLVHGEGPVWDDEKQALYWVDVASHNVYRMDYKTGNVEFRHFEYGEVNTVTPVANSSDVLVTVRAEAYLLDWDCKKGDAGLRLLSAVDIGRPCNVINEGKADAKGRFWAGTKGKHCGKDVYPDQATLYMISEENHKNPEIKIRPVSISNGLCWSHDNTKFYYVDSSSYQIAVYDFELETGHITVVCPKENKPETCDPNLFIDSTLYFISGNRKTLIDIREHGYSGLPDGMTIDADGNLWVAVIFDGVVLHIDAVSGEIIKAYKMPAKNVTSVMWGGPNLDILYVTSSCKGFKDSDFLDQPSAGSVFTISNTGHRGVPTYKFKFDKEYL